MKILILVSPDELKNAKNIFPTDRFEVEAYSHDPKIGQIAFVLVSKMPTDPKLIERFNALNQDYWTRFATTSVQVGSFITGTYLHLDLASYYIDTSFFEAVRDCIVD